MTRTQHYPDCDKPGMPADRCRVCTYIEKGYAAGVQDERKRSVLLIADAYAAGVQAARDAVADRRVPWPTATGDLVNEGISDALAAIDALRGQA